jgi:hypothetical protein
VVNPSHQWDRKTAYDTLRCARRSLSSRGTIEERRYGGRGASVAERQFAPGCKPSARRKRGTPNKLSKTAKGAIVKAAKALGGEQDLDGFFEDIGRRNPERLADYIVHSCVPKAREEDAAADAVTVVACAPIVVPSGCQCLPGFTVVTMEEAARFWAWFKQSYGSRCFADASVEDVRAFFEHQQQPAPESQLRLIVDNSGDAA